MGAQSRTEAEAKKANKELGVRLQAARKLAGLDQSEVARRLGVAPITVSRWERGAQEMKWGDLRSVAAVLHIPIARLMGLPEAMHISERGDNSDYRSLDTSLALDSEERERLVRLEAWARRMKQVADEIEIVAAPGEGAGDEIPAALSVVEPQPLEEPTSEPRRRRAPRKGA